MTTARLCVIAGVCTFIIGSVIAWPLAYAAVHYQASQGRVMEVFTQTTDDGRVRVSVCYEFAIPSDRGHVYALGYTQADRRLHPIADPVLTVSEAARLMQSLKRDSLRRIFFDVNDPIGSAFMISEAAAGSAGLRVESGVALILVGSMACGIGFLGRRRSA